ncbi:hypothetical protein NQ318_013708 [Aromia moschata]|uniref:Uncharacterized protein n=1 Tax=Aromia moschata TaxID=1265417 RepID=A0AAV8ZA00_9CUCU|nr:hypothetical protein NQ318_013708 [Aromia moschata]
MDAIDLLEKRIEALELQVLPKDKNDTIDKTHAITDLLLQTHTMITSALSCREAITSILQHMTTINEYLDPTNGENVLEVEAKRHYLLELYPELKDTVQLIGTFESLVPYTRFGKHRAGYRAIGKIGSTRRQQFENITILLIPLRYCLRSFDKAVTDLENALQPKFATEE